MRFRTAVADIITVREDGALRVKGVITQDGEEYLSDFVFIAPGRDGSGWLTDILGRRKIPMYNNQVDVGVRVETSDIVMREIRELYEGKFIYTLSGHPGGTFAAILRHVAVENQRRDCRHPDAQRSQSGLGNTNSPSWLPQVYRTLNKPNEMPGKLPASQRFSSGGLIIQKLAISCGAGAPPKADQEGFIEPTLKEAVPGDLGLVLPYTTMKSLIEMTHALDKVTPGIASDHTLFYGVEAKFYSARPKLTVELETEVKGLYCGGDGAGITRGLAQAGASGVWVARCILDKM